MTRYLLICTACAWFALSACGGSKSASASEPKWVTHLIDSLEHAKYNNGAAVSKYSYEGKTVYYVQAPCCDQMNALYDETGVLMCYPDGGFTGRGDGKCPGFKNGAEMLAMLWQANADSAP